jgi:hypothetical protein
VTAAAGQHEGLSSRETAERKAKKKEGRKMKRKIFYGLGAILVGALTLAAVANGPYYALPAWAQKLVCATTSNCPRFIVLADWNSEAVLDRETGLVWQKSPSASTNWSSARERCSSERTGGRKGWRLPSVHELASLVDPTQLNPALPSGHPFPSVQSTFYWSATTLADNTDTAWIVGLGTGGVHPAGAKSSFDFSVWCVRGGMNADQY